MARRAGTSERGTIRCAIYTRKSTEEGLEQEFNSLDAQYEACAAYILSQRHEGWSEVRDRYDDGGFSGGNMNRPGLKRLLADIETGKVDVIVVYKVDRLTRALSDFARIVDVLDARGASFVSVTQAFNTTTSMGRLTLNVLLSFAQFEREVTGERIRDKIAASKRKGMWMGGPVPLGYRVAERKLLIDDADAVIVRHIFERYLALGSGRALIEDLRADGYRTKVRTSGDRTIGGIPFSRGMLFAMLANPVYIGKIVHHGDVHEGEHDAIIPPGLWDAVQQHIAANRVQRSRGQRGGQTSLLAGIIRDGLGRRMTPSHAVKGKVRYRYYITHASELRDGEAPAWRMPASGVEAVVRSTLANWLVDRQAIGSLLVPECAASSIAATIDAAGRTAVKLDNAATRRAVIGALVDRIVVEVDRIVITLNRDAPRQLLGSDLAADAKIVLTAPAVKLRQGKATKLLLTNQQGSAITRDEKLITLLIEARAARTAVIGSPNRSIKQIAADTHQCRHRFMRLLRLSWLAPDIVTAICEGRYPRHLTPGQLLVSELPPVWSAQKALLGFA